MRHKDYDSTYRQDSWDEETEYADLNENGEYEAYDEYEDYDDYDLDEELHSEHSFRIAMSVFDLISMLIGIAVILVLTALLFGLFNWVQRDLSQSLSVITAPFR
ncbi:MAG TPA: hypothetical protein PKU80_07960 [Candidatus Limiplasma sp.]|nr:hypothetical protein [Candidatus Limiplasma sp.]HRX09047.1 hypothetical protein [Candidatus Limiplasma sp.]